MFNVSLDGVMRPLIEPFGVLADPDESEESEDVEADETVFWWRFEAASSMWSGLRLRVAVAR